MQLTHAAAELPFKGLSTRFSVSDRDEEGIRTLAANRRGPQVQGWNVGQANVTVRSVELGTRLLRHMDLSAASTVKAQRRAVLVIFDARNRHWIGEPPEAVRPLRQSRGRLLGKRERHRAFPPVAGSG